MAPNRQICSVSRFSLILLSFLEKYHKRKTKGTFLWPTEGWYRLNTLSLSKKNAYLFYPLVLKTLLPKQYYTKRGQSSWSIALKWSIVSLDTLYIENSDRKCEISNFLWVSKKLPYLLIKIVKIMDGINSLL